MIGHLTTLFGSGKGPLLRLSPHARLICSILVLVAALISLPDPLSGILFTLCVTIVFLLLCRMPLRHLMRASIGVLLMSAPFLCFLLMAGPYTFAFSQRTPLDVDAITGKHVAVVALKGMSCALIVLSALSTVSFSELNDALARLPLPRIVVLLILQILHQTKLLLDETTRISKAFAVRGATSGMEASFLTLRHFPQTWLPRMVAKSERVANAMDLRGYGAALPQFDRGPLLLHDWFALSIATLFLCMVIANRLLGCV
jgi:energy-coupling factor transporter transmembrane protein EcfT